MGRKRRKNRRRNSSNSAVSMQELMENHNGQFKTNQVAEPANEMNEQVDEWLTRYQHDWCDECSNPILNCTCSSFGVLGVTNTDGSLKSVDEIETPTGKILVAGPGKSARSVNAATSNYGSRQYGWGCYHWKQPVNVGNQIIVHCSSWMDEPTKGNSGKQMDISCYFDPCYLSGGLLASPNWNGPTRGNRKEIALLDWPDFNRPDNLRLFVDTMEHLLNCSADGKQVEIGCKGGHGRTGTAIAAMRILLGETADVAKKWVWRNYCWSAIETQSQETFLDRVESYVESTIFRNRGE